MEEEANDSERVGGEQKETAAVNLGKPVLHSKRDPSRRERERGSERSIWLVDKTLRKVIRFGVRTAYVRNTTRYLEWSVNIMITRERERVLAV